jgi:hypothetical protein
MKEGSTYINLEIPLDGAVVAQVLHNRQDDNLIRISLKLLSAREKTVEHTKALLQHLHTDGRAD